MKRSIKLIFTVEFFLIIVFIGIAQAFACTNKQTNTALDDILAQEIKRQINKGQLPLYYPKSVKRFYDQRKFEAVWIKKQTGEGTAWQAMLMIDCVLQYGLLHNDYHPQDLTYNTLHSLLDTPDKADIKAQARFEIMLTDAMMSFINNLHFGKLNVDYPPIKTDRLNKQGFNADFFLINALKENTLLSALPKAQPDLKEYVDLQNHMRLLTGTYQSDCYEVPEGDIRKMAINMERLRWQYTTGKPAYITCLVKEGVIVFYDDVDKRDEGFEAVLYGID
jgi:murein L,D-transpeptidase YcbB/YkuD